LSSSWTLEALPEDGANDVPASWRDLQPNDVRRDEATC
jgi:hypothetical protein